LITETGRNQVDSRKGHNIPKRV